MSVITCAATVTEAQRANVQSAANLWPNLKLSPFQVHAIAALQAGHHSLVTAHTGAGKTLPAEYAIQDAVSRGKRLVYTAPLKALSNTKLMELRLKYPSIEFGLITGDIKDNPDAQVLIMTTEILATRLASAGDPTVAPSSLSFEIDFEQLAYVVFDEVHYINDRERGAAWEQCMILLPGHVQFVMLSATIASPQYFAGWVASLSASKPCCNPKDVHLSGSVRRPVPLEHHIWLEAGKAQLPKGHSWTGVLKQPVSCVNTAAVQKALSAAKYLKDPRTSGKPSRDRVLKGLVAHLAAKGKLPAICFVFSRRQTTCLANSMDRTLIADPEAAARWAQTARAECLKILREGCKSDQFDACTQTEEFEQIVRWAERGVAVHHGGMIPIFRELVEILFSRGKLKLVFATETLAVGVNFSTKSVIFTDLSKFDGECHRPLRSHEYGQMAGRAGRRGLDDRGDVWICLNLVRTVPTRGQLNGMQTGPPQQLASSFYLDPSNVLSSLSPAVADGREAVAAICQRSFMAKECRDQANALSEELAALGCKLEAFRRDRDSDSRLPSPEVIRKYASLSASSSKADRRQAAMLRAEERGLEIMISLDAEEAELVEEHKRLSGRRATAEAYPLEMASSMYNFLGCTGCIGTDGRRTELGRIAAGLRESVGIPMATLCDRNLLRADANAADLGALLSVFYPSPFIADERYTAPAQSLPDPLRQTAIELVSIWETVEDEATRHGQVIRSSKEASFDCMELMRDWFMAESEEEQSAVIATWRGHGVSAGDIVKCAAKTVNAAEELTDALRGTRHVELASTLSKVKLGMTKGVVRSDSLYV